MPTKEINLEDFDQKLIRQLRMIGFGEALTARVIEKFGEEGARKVIEEDPYKFMDLDGISFRRADDIAQLCGILDKNDPRRQRALIKHVLDQNSVSGHTCLPMWKLEKELKKQKVTDYLKLLEELVKEESIKVEKDGDDIYIFLKKYYDAEVGVADKIKQVQEIRHQDRIIPQKIAMSMEDDQVKDDDQINAIMHFGKRTYTIITGGPGTGKSYITATICNIINFNEESLVLCAPTGKAAKRLQEVTGRRAFTLHMLLKANFTDFSWGYNAENHLTKYDWVIVDESSMIDIVLAWRLLQALPISTRIVFIGDADQLAPVGPGSFFRDMIKSGKVPIFRLQTNHRQGAGSMIAENALRINRGELKLSFGPDLIFEEAPNPIIVREKIIDLVKELKEDYPDVLRDIQILSPQKGTQIGTEALNKMLRYELNPTARSDQPFSVGDKIMQTVNNYRLGIFNGFVGEILEVTRSGYKIDFFDHKIIDYPINFQKQLMFAYACTIHKYQGSEVKAGILIISTTHTYMLTRNLIYTGMTRFKEKCIILADRMGLKRAITNRREATRYSRLLERLNV